MFLLEVCHTRRLHGYKSCWHHVPVGARPSPPTISCPSDVIPENTLLTCTCNANNIGQPGGRLRWYNGTGSGFSTEVVSANYDVTTLDMTWAVTRGDDGRKFRCVNNWTVKVNAGSDYTASVAWGPDTVSIEGNTSFYTDTIGSNVMTLTCLANEVNPSSALTYNWDVLCDEKQQSNCTFRVRPGPNGDDNTVITCTVTNSKNNNNQRQKSVILDIKYPPPSDPQISGYVNGQVLYEGDNLTLTCAVTGGDPQVTSVTLTCQGRSKKKITNGQSSSLEFSPLSSSDHNLTCVCSGQWAMQGYYNLTDSRTLTVNYRTSDTKLTINNENNITVSEKEAVTLTCQSRGRPAPELKLLQRGVELARHNGSQLSLSVKRSQLSHNTTARCDNTGIITCRASNGLGSAQNISVQLYVNCKPRSIIAVPVTPKVNFINKPVTAAFDLEAFPLPDNFTFQYLGNTQNSRGSQPVPANIELRAECSNTYADFAVRCNVSVDKAKDSTAEGFYTFTAANAFGEGQFVFQVTLDACPSPPTISCPSDYIPENTPLTCTCNAKNIGQPGGRLRWYTGTGSDFNTEVISANYDVTTLETTRTVTRGDNGRKFRCVNNWMVKVNAGSDYTASVAWGPDTVSIDGNTPFYTDTTGSKVMTLTCQVNGVNPSSALTYNWNVLCDDKQQNTCNFRPRPGPNGDDNTVITCTATNIRNNKKQRQKSVTLDIKYPPLSAPQIGGYINGQVLYEGDNLTLTCAVAGGDPQVTSVTLACRSKQKTTNGQSSSLEFSPLSSSDHNLTCVCSGQWARESDYTLTDSRTLTVYCEMRIARDSFSSVEDGVPVLDNSPQQGELHFQVLTTDTPHTASFLYLGTDSTGAGYPPTSGLLSATCAQTSLAYKSRCVLTASNVTQQWIGYYNVTIATSTQTVSFTFRLQMKKSADNNGPSDSRGLWFEGLGVGLGVGLAVLVVENLVLVLCLWRRHWRLPYAESSDNKGPSDSREPWFEGFGVGLAVPVEPSLETEMPACATSDAGPYEELKLHDIGLRSEYGVMSHPAPTSSDAPETEGGYEIPVRRPAPAAAARRK
ncbi:hypothetical protein ACOMHN_063940 [Nucella lapillus]